jgi:anti-sigma regulatory factor (Ser/Thr protein kinase)
LSDEIVLAIPARADFRQIAQLVVGGVGSQLGATVDRLDDLQTALEALLAHRGESGEVRIAVGIDDDAVRVTVGPFAARELARLDDGGGALGLRRVLETLTDGFDVESGEDGSWVAVRKQLASTYAGESR